MDERNKIEQLLFEEKDSTMKKNRNDNNSLKHQSRFKLKLEFFKKLPHSILSNSALEKARAIFPMLEIKHNEVVNTTTLILSSNQQQTNVDNSSPFDSILIHQTTQKNKAPAISTMPTAYIAPSNVIKMDKINSNDKVDREISNFVRNEHRLTSDYLKNKYKQYLKPTLLLPKQYFNDLLNNHDHDHSATIHEQGFYPHPPLTLPNSTSMYPKRKYPIHNYFNMNHPISSNHSMSITSYNYQPYACSQSIKTLSDETYRQPSLSIMRSLPSSSMLIWNKCVRRLNTEYQLTIIALQQTKEYLEQNFSSSTKPTSKYTSLMTHDDTKSLWKNERKKPNNVTFSLPLPRVLSTDLENFSSTSKSIKNIDQNHVLSSNAVFKPKFIKPVQLNSFSQSFKLNPVSSNDENNEKLDSIDSIINKLNDLNNALSTIKMEFPTVIENSNSSSSAVSDTSDNINISSKTSIITGSLAKTPDQTLADSSPSSQSVLKNKNHQSENSLYDVETTYTIETFYKGENDNQNDSLPNSQHVVIIKENTTEEQFNLANQKLCQRLQTENIYSQKALFSDESNISPHIYSLLNPMPTKNFNSNETLSNPLTNKNSSSTLVNNDRKITNSFAPLKNNNLSLSKISKNLKLTKTNISHVAPTSKDISSSNELKTLSAKAMNNSSTKIPKPIKATKSKVSPQSLSNTHKKIVTNNSHIHESQHRMQASISALGKNRVKTIVNQINANTSMISNVSSLRTNKGISSSIPIRLKISTMKNDIQKN